MKSYAIASCRVSTPEQRLNNSLNRQEESVLKAATELGVTIARWWSGDISSKAGTNVKRKDLSEMLEFCKASKRVKYLIVDEPDRFMRSIDEAFYFEVTFRQLGVTVWYASDPNLNAGDLNAKMLKFSKYFPAEGENVKRQNSSIDGHRKAIAEGRYTFPPKPGYIKGIIAGVHLPHPVSFEPFKKALKEVASGLYTPTQSLKRLNTSDFTRVHSPFRMDKFSRFITDPYYAGILEMNKQVVARCEIGQHEPMISRNEHIRIVDIVKGRKIVQRASGKQYNPEFPMSKYLVHDCQDGAKFTGGIQDNGHGGLYPKYRCRKCNKQYKRADVHEAITNVLEQFDYGDAQKKEFQEALTAVWEEKKRDIIQQAKALQTRLEELQKDKSSLAKELARVDVSLKPDIEEELHEVKAQIEGVEATIRSQDDLEDDRVEFIKFGLEYTNRLKDDWWKLNQEERAQCKQLLFPAGIQFNSDKKVSTTHISPLYRLAASKKNLDFSRDSLLVELRGTAPRSASLQSILLQA